MISRRFTLTGLLLFTAFAGLVLALVVPRWRHSHRQRTGVVAIAASADGSTFAAIIGDGLLVWDSAGNLRRQLKAPATVYGKLVLSFDGKLFAVSAPSGFAEIYSLDTGKRQQTSPVQISDICFSPTQASFIGLGWAGDWGGIYAPCSLGDASPPALLATRPYAMNRKMMAAFSPDGKSFAVVSNSGVIELYDAATSRLIKKKNFTSQSASQARLENLVWAPDGRSILTMAQEGVQRGSQTTLTTAIIERWNVDTGDVRRVALPSERFFHEALAYLPGDSSRFVASRQSRLALFDAETLKPLPVTTADYYGQFAVGIRGETFLARNGRGVDLLDASTLELRRRLFEAASPPNGTPVFVGLFAWCTAFFLHRIRQNARFCQKCGQRFRVAGKKDLNIECPPCRRRAQPQVLAPSLADDAAASPATRA